MVLADNLRVHPDVLFGNGGGVFGSGVQGSGKTGILVRILEQASLFHVPMIIFDRESDILPAVERFPRGVVGTFSTCPTARDVVSGGLQVIYDLSTWPTMDERGEVIGNLGQDVYKCVYGRRVFQP